MMLVWLDKASLIGNEGSSITCIPIATYKKHKQNYLAFSPQLTHLPIYPSLSGFTYHLPLPPSLPLTSFYQLSSLHFSLEVVPQSKTLSVQPIDVAWPAEILQQFVFFFPSSFQDMQSFVSPNKVLRLFSPSAGFTKCWVCEPFAQSSKSSLSRWIDLFILTRYNWL